MTGKLPVLFIAVAVLGLFTIPVLAEDTVTLTLPGGHQYYLGDDIPLMGSSTAGTTVYVLFTGPGLPPEGAPLHNPNVSVYGGGWTTTTVLADNSYGYLWKTDGLTLSEGTYTIYAVSGPKPITNLNDSSYGSIVLPLTSPPLTLAVSPGIIKPGQEIALSGVVQGTPSPGVLIWIIGEEFTSVVSAPIHENGTYQYLIPDSTTTGMATGEYHVLAQHPMGNDAFDVIRQGDSVIGTSPVPGTALFTLQGEGSLKGEEAAQALAAALDNAAIDDVYREAVFQVTPNPPNLPHAFYGNVTIDGSPAPLQTTISVRVTGGIDAVNYLVTTEEGIYGGRDEDAPKLIVQGIIENGAPVSFYIDGRRAEVSDGSSGSTWQMTYPFIAGAVTDLSLRIQDEQPDSYVITASSGPGGIISPVGLVAAAPGSSVNFTIFASDGYAIQSVLVDGIESETDGTYQFTNIAANHTISASFEAIEELPDRYYINASAGNGGVIAPSGQVEVVPTETITFTITASPGYTVQNIVVDGENQVVSDSFTFTNISGNHTIAASFVASGGDGGSVGKGTLYVTSIPRGALITIDGVVKGQTNAIISNVAAGIHNVTLTRSGYQPETKLVDVKAGGMNSVAFTLKESGEAGTGTGTLYISSIPSGA
ncbi:MAG TPA: PEGA domain-containing protein, partial [Methanoregulaceae archaeon]|nr:PEGA domain-containing protein [Methanoregulaceae archaeon]